MSRIVFGTGRTGVPVTSASAVGNIIGNYPPAPARAKGDGSGWLEKDGSRDRVSVTVFTGFLYYRN